MGISEFPLAHCIKVLFPAPVTPMTVMKAHGAPSTVSGLKSLLMTAANFRKVEMDNFDNSYTKVSSFVLLQQYGKVNAGMQMV
jgi:hypothetical protein